MFGALQARDYRLLWLGMLVSNVGSWMQLVALGWQVYLLTDSPFYLGLVGLARALPVFVFALVGGVVADRFDRRHVMLAANLVSMVCAALLGVLTLSGQATVWAVIALAFVTAGAFAFEVPARQSLIPDLVPRQHMVNAIGLNGAAFNAASVVGPSLAALAIDWFGLGWAYLANSASFLAVNLALLLMKAAPRPALGSSHGMLGTLLEGLRYVGRTPLMLVLLSSVAILSLLVRPYVQLMPVFARDVLGGDATNLGLLLATAGIGALGGSLAVAYFGSFPGRGLVLLLMGGLFALSIVGFSMSRSVVLSAVLTMLSGFASTFYLASTNSMLQINARAGLRGRVVSLYSLVVMGFMPLGSMLLGSLGDAFGVPLALAACAAIALAWVTIVAVAFPHLRRLE
jgi:predicted MFS family arabinose efflux permease